MNATQQDTTPRVWIGCLACYNEGRLLGAWHDAIGAGEVTTEDLHAAEGRKPYDEFGQPHEELWVMDHEYLPITGECAPMEAQRLAELVESVDESNRAAFVAWMSYDSNYNTEPDAFEEAYCGEWESFREYADEQADESMQALAPSGPFAKDFEAAHEWLTQHFNWEQYSDELEHDHYTVPAPEYRVFIFRNY